MNDQIEAERKPIFRWAGSKRKQVDRLSEYWSEDYERYVEPFAGSAGLFLHLAPNSALIADKNAELIEAYKVITNHPTTNPKSTNGTEITSIPRAIQGAGIVARFGTGTTKRKPSSPGGYSANG